MRPKLRRAPKQEGLAERLVNEAKRLGVSLAGTVDAQREEYDTALLQERVLAMRREKRDAALWWVALVSAIASALSALAAWAAHVLPDRLLPR
ncbi:MAG: hypothetical protein ACE149_00640 [Armatimonadota bacterium]